MHRIHPTIGLAVALLLAGCTSREQTSRPDTNPHPPPTFVEAEPSEGAIESRGLDRLTIAFTQGLLIEIHAKPVSFGSGTWGFELELEVYNRLPSGVFDLGTEPLAIFTVAVTAPDGTGFGSGGGCSFGSDLHGSKERALEPGQRYGWRDGWMEGVEAGHVLEVGIVLCNVQLPDGRSLRGEIAKLDVVVGTEGKLAKFELHAVAVPQPE
jgi:hypothetical protein